MAWSVTKHNFEALRPRMLAAIEAADVIAVDGEFSGLIGTPGIAPNLALDSVASRFCRTRDGAKHTALLQFGFATFAHAGEGRWVAEAFSVNLCQEWSSFLAHTDAIAFLHANGFDFNKWAQGVDYLSQFEEARERAIQCVPRIGRERGFEDEDEDARTIHFSAFSPPSVLSSSFSRSRACPRIAVPFVSQDPHRSPLCSATPTAGALPRLAGPRASPPLPRSHPPMAPIAPGRLHDRFVHPREHRRGSRGGQPTCAPLGDRGRGDAHARIVARSHRDLAHRSAPRGGRLASARRCGRHL